MIFIMHSSVFSILQNILEDFMVSIAVAQSFPLLADMKANIESIHGILDSVQSDIIVFPELATSGYFFTDKNDLLPLSLEWNASKILQQFQERAIVERRVIILGFPEFSEGKLYNSAGIFMPDAQSSKVYRKTHLFYKEHTVFEPGDTGFFCVHEPTLDCTIGTMICYDWRFPESARSLALQGADVIVCPSNLVTTLSGKVFPARAIENKVYVAVANRIGEEMQGDETLLFRGESAIYDYLGDRIALASSDKPEIIIAKIDPAATRDKSFNEVNDIFRDRKTYMYFENGK